MHLAAVVIIALQGALNVWVEPSTARVFPDTTAAFGSAREVRLHAAGGERESFQVCVRAEDKAAGKRKGGQGAAVEGLRIEAEALDGAIGAPEVRLVGYLSLDDASPAGDVRAQGAPAFWPDPLMDAEPFTLTPGETRAFWVSYTVPANAKAGLHSGKIAVVYDGKKRVSIPVTLTVFPFSLPETPSLRTAFQLDRRAIRAFYGIADTDLDAWKGIYDAFSRGRFSYRVWDGGDLVKVEKPDTPSDATHLKEHLEYAVPAAHMNTVDIGPAGFGVSVFGPPAEETLQDPVQFYLHDMCGCLEEKGWLDKAFLETASIGSRETWQTARDASFRVKRADKRIHRLVRGPVHPYFERYVELWATPLRAFDPFASAALRDGQALVDPNAASVRKVTASSSQGGREEGDAPAPPADACDGSLFSYWLSEGAPTKKNPEWLRIDFSVQVTSDRLKLVWRNGFEGDDVRLEFLIEGKWTEPTQLEWLSYPASQPFAHSWAEVKWVDLYTFDAIRLTFRSTFAGRPVGVTEVTVGEATDPKDLPKTDVRLEPWLSTEPKAFPSLAVKAHPVEARIMPWICWGHKLSGFLHDGLNSWPETWVAAFQNQPAVWPAASRGESFLFYPGRKGPIPSIRSETLLDGMEDFEYLVLLNQALERGEIVDPPTARLCARRLYGPAPSADELRRMAAQIAKDRTAIGWALSELKGKKRPASERQEKAKTGGTH